MEGLGWLQREMEGLEERGTGMMLTEEEEASMFWAGGGEALRCKRQREWEEGAWEEFGVTEEEARGDLPTYTDKLGVEEVNVGLMEGEMNAKVIEMRGSGGMVGNMDGGGCGMEEGGGQVTGESKRKPLRGKRRSKRSIREEGERKMANTLFNWLGNQKQ